MSRNPACYRRIFEITFATTLLLAAAPLMAQHSVVAPGARLRAESRVAFTEGPVWHPDGYVLFSDIANNRIMRWTAGAEVEVFRTPSGRANGLLLDDRKRLHACEGGERRVTRTEADGSVTVLADRYQDKRFNSPNDLTMDKKGRIYFTDPRYGDRSDLEIFDEQGRSVEGVYRIDQDGSVAQIIRHEVHRPNGIAISPDQQFLYVADNVNDGPNNGVGGNRKLWRFDLRADGTVAPESRKLLFDWGTDRGPDGMTVDAAGTLFVTAGFNFPNLPAETVKTYRAGVYVLSNEGRLLDVIKVPADMITNCSLGGKDRRTLYITAGHKLWSVELRPLR